MRAALIIGTVLALGIPVAGQTPNSFFTGANPRDIKIVPFDASKAMQNLNINNAFRTPTQTKAFDLSSILPKVHLPSWPPVIPTTSILSQKNNPYQPNPIYGRNLFSQTPAK